LCGFYLCPVRPLWRGGKGGSRAKTLVLVWTFCALKFRHQPTTRRPLPPMVVSNLQPLCGVSALLGGIEKTL